MSEIKKIFEYPEEKISIIKNYTDAELLDFLNQINTQDERQRLKKKLDYFVPNNLKSPNTPDYIKYGDETRIKYINALKKDTKDNYKKVYRRNKEVGYKDLNPWDSENPFCFAAMWLLWVFSQPEFDCSFYEEFKLLNNIEAEDREFLANPHFVKYLVQKNKENNTISKETIQIFYKFGPFIPDNDIEQEINKCFDKNLIISTFQKKSNNLREENNKLRKNVSELAEEKNLYEKWIEDLKQETSRLQGQLKGNEEREAFFVRLEKEITELKDENINLLSLKQRLLKNEEYKIYKNIGENEEEKKYLVDLILNDDSLSNKIIDKLGLKQEIIQKHKEYFEDKLNSYKDNVYLSQKSELDNQINDLSSKKEELENNLFELEQKQNNFLKPIMDEFKNSKNEIISSYFAIKEIISQEMENKQNKLIENNFELFNYEENMNLPLYESEEEFIDKFQTILSKEKIISPNNAINATSWHLAFKSFKNLIVNDKRIIDCWIKALGINLPIINTLVEPQWQSYRDWFGYFEKNEFNPSNTLIADYYGYLRENSNAFIGFINFFDFNKILPDFYLLPFMKSLNDLGGLNLVNPRLTLNKNDSKYRKIEKFEKLNFIFIPCRDNINSFEIPTEFYNYTGELINYDNNDSDIIEIPNKRANATCWNEWIKNKNDNNKIEVEKFLNIIIGKYNSYNYLLSPNIFEDIINYTSFGDLYLSNEACLDLAISQRLINTIPKNSSLIKELKDIFENVKLEKSCELLEKKLNDLSCQ